MTARRVGRHAGLVGVPHGAKSYLAAALALGGARERLVWIARDAEIGDRVAEELGAWLGDPEAVAVLEPRTALAYERSELVADETAARVAALAAWRSGRARVLVASVQALLQHTIAPDDLPAEPRELAARRPAPPGRTAARAVRPRLRAGHSRSPAAASSRAGAASSTSSRRRCRCRSGSSSSATRSTRCARSTRPTSAPSGRSSEAVLLPASRVPAAAGGRGRASAIGSGRGADGSPSGSPPTSPGSRAQTTRSDATAPGRRRAARPGRSPSATRPRSGRRTSPRRPASTTSIPARCSSSTSRATSPRPPSSCGARPTSAGPSSSRPASCPKDWPSTYLPPRDWKGRLVGSRTLELTWESEPPAGAAMAAARSTPGDLFGWREPHLPLGRAGRDSPDAVEAGRRTGRGSCSHRTRRRVSPRSSPRPGTRRRSWPGCPRRRHPARSRSSSAASTAASPAAPTSLAFVTDRELFGTVRVRRPKALRRVVPRDILERLTAGDLVVHIDHGVARYEQMLRRCASTGEERDFLELAFAGGDRIFVPVEQIGRVTRYAGGEQAAPQQARRGGMAAHEAARREGRHGPREGAARAVCRRGASRRATPSPADTPWQAEMEASFPYEETVDQLRAVTEVKADMERVGRWTGWSWATSATARPRSRCAPRSRRRRTASRSRSSSRRRSSPPSTTATFSQRFAAFPLEVRLLSRFVSAKEQAATLAGLADGSVDVVIGTHRLLSKDVRFHDLGLVVVDEEQRFGVAAKERLKQLRREVDVLTLSATPIPRTLNLALAGVRDLSVIETPPEDRLPIQTRVAEASAGLVRDAILRELDRGGQVFFVHNRVETIEAQAEQLRRMLPDARFVVGHGQMAEGALEKVMLAFADGEADVLVCTTIIESGLDIPNANTIIIDRADTLGLAQLYQLRGRVGRSVAARLRLPPVSTPRAAERRGAQAAPGDLQRLRAGRRLPDRAVGPRDPRGRQHPRRRAVGSHGGRRVRPLLAPACRGRRGRRKPSCEGRAPIVAPPQAVVDLPVEAHLPDEYVPDEAQKLELYRRLARARTTGDLAAFRQEVTDRFGPMPQPVVRLVEVAELRLAAEAAGVSSISREEGWLVVRFGAGLSRATAMRPAGRGGLPGVRAGDVTFASNQVRIRVPANPVRAWELTQAVVARLAAPH